MNVDDVRATIGRIRDAARDPELAHVREDALYYAVLALIASGECQDPQGCAAEAIKSRDIEFPRHCA